MRITAVHGIAQTYEGEATLKPRWLQALNVGLEEAGHRPLGGEEFTLVAFGSLFRPPGARAVRGLGRGAEGEWEAEMIRAWWEAAAVRSEMSRRNELSGEMGEDPTIQGPDFEGRFRTPQVLQHALRQLSKSRFFKWFGPHRVLVLPLSQVRMFLHDPETKREVLERMEAKISDETEVVIGHSLGSIVAYEALCAGQGRNVRTFITLGSPLGIRHLIFDALTPRPESGRGQWPGTVESWYNIADEGDLVALEKRLSPLFGSVNDVLVHNGWRSHDVKRYLTAKETGEAIAEGLRG